MNNTIILTALQYYFFIKTNNLSVGCLDSLMPLY